MDISLFGKIENHKNVIFFVSSQNIFLLNFKNKS